MLRLTRGFRRERAAVLFRSASIATHAAGRAATVRSLATTGARPPRSDRGAGCRGGVWPGAAESPSRHCGGALRAPQGAHAGLTIASTSLFTHALSARRAELA